MQVVPNKLLVIGLQSAGKTSIINRLMENEFDPNVRPTLGTQIHRFVLQQTKIELYDLGGQLKLRKNWYDQSLKPSGIVYVVDCTEDTERMKLEREEFYHILDFHYGKLSPDDQKKIPLLILGNKIDIAKEDYPYLLKNLFFDIKKTYNYRMGYCSAKENQGIMENFSWLIGEFAKVL